MEENVRFIKTHKKVIVHKNLNPIQRKAYNAWTNQLSKCNNIKNPDYQYYGGIGIRVMYSRKDFIAWYEDKIKSYVGENPSIGRIDHSKDYCFSNIEIISTLENTRERVARRGLPIGNKSKKVAIVSKRDNEIIAIFDSVNKCSDFFGVESAHISQNCRSKNPTGSEKYSWYYRFVG